jgi:hypothetical protein
MRIVASVTAALLAATPAYSADAVSPSKPATTDASLSGAVQQGYDHGFHDCARALDKIVRFVETEETAYAHMGLWAKDRPNDSTFTTVTSLGGGDGGGVNVFSATKNTNGTCDVVAVQNIFSTDPCGKLKDATFKEWKYFGDLRGSQILEDPTTPNADVVLTNEPGNACLVTKQISGYGLPNQ